jgi:hypothetical protein
MDPVCDVNTVIGVLDNRYPFLSEFRGFREHDWQERLKVSLRECLIGNSTLLAMFAALRKDLRIIAEMNARDCHGFW